MCLFTFSFTKSNKLIFYFIDFDNASLISAKCPGNILQWELWSVTRKKKEIAKSGQLVRLIEIIIYRKPKYLETRAWKRFHFQEDIMVWRYRKLERDLILSWECLEFCLKWEAPWALWEVGGPTKREKGGGGAWGFKVGTFEACSSILMER